MRILDEASWADGDVMSEYFGGVMASARSKKGVDDRGAAWAATLAGMATVDVHLHYLVYRALRDEWLGRLDLLNPNWPEEMTTFFSAPTLLRALQRPTSSRAVETELVPGLATLLREGLIGSNYMLGNADALAKQYRCEMTESGLVVQPSLAGIQLFMWAHGLGRESPSRFADPDAPFDTVDDLAPVNRAQPLARIRADGPLPPEQMVVTLRISPSDDDEAANARST